MSAQGIMPKAGASWKRQGKRLTQRPAMLSSVQLQILPADFDATLHLTTKTSERPPSPLCSRRALSSFGELARRGATRTVDPAIRSKMFRLFTLKAGRPPNGRRAQQGGFFGARFLCALSLVESPCRVTRKVGRREAKYRFEKLRRSSGGGANLEWFHFSTYSSYSLWRRPAALCNSHAHY
jgi:hypothetical protein